jgi:hypothetical protein
MAIDINEMNEMFVVEWSPSHKQFRIRTIRQMLKSNLNAAVHGQGVSQVPVAIAGTEEEALKMSNIIEVKLEKLRQAHRASSSDTLG